MRNRNSFLASRTLRKQNRNSFFASRVLGSQNRDSFFALHSAWGSKLRFVFGFVESPEIEIENCFRLRGMSEVTKRDLFFDP